MASKRFGMIAIVCRVVWRGGPAMEMGVLVGKMASDGDEDGV
jgi:hypothetical protein